MKEDSEGDSGSNDVPTSRAADSTVSNGKVNGPISVVASQPRRLHSDRPPAMGVALASLGAENHVASSGLACTTMAEHGSIPIGGTTLAHALLGITMDVSRGSNGSSSNNGDSITGGIHSTNSAGIGKSLKGDSNGQNRGKEFECNICHRKFGYKHVLQNHERTHTGEKPFECKECNKRFTRDHHLKTHMRLHTGEKPYHCEYCDRQFVQVANLRRHLRVHTGERPYACTLCTSRFSDSNQLKAHHLIHEGIKPFECEKCRGRFRRRHHLLHHKCPSEPENMGKPRRGRRPKAYDQLATSLPMCVTPVLQERLSTPIPALPPPTPQAKVTPVITRTSPQPMQTPPLAHMHQARRNHVHVLQHHLNLAPNTNGKYHDTMQSSPLDMTVSSVTNNSVSVIVPLLSQQHNNINHSNNLRMDGVLDLSNSRSDSEAEPIEEEVDEEDGALDSDSDDDERKPLLPLEIRPTSPPSSQRFAVWNEAYGSDSENSNVALQLTT